MTIYEFLKNRLNLLNYRLGILNVIFGILIWVAIVYFNVVVYFTGTEFILNTIISNLIFSLGFVFIFAVIFLQLKKLIERSFKSEIELKDSIEYYPDAKNRVNANLVETSVNRIINTIRQSNPTKILELEDLEIELRTMLSTEKLTDIILYNEAEKVVSILDKEVKE